MYPQRATFVASMERECCNPFGKDKCKSKGNLVPISVATAADLQELTNRPFLPGEKMCEKCKDEFKKRRSMQPSESEEDELEEDSERMEAKIRANNSLVSLGEPPLRLSLIRKRDAGAYLKRKIKRAKYSIANTIATAAGVDIADISDDDSVESCYKCSDLSTLIEDLKKKFTKSNHETQLQILTLAPDSWTMEETATEFNTSARMVKQGRKLKEKAGVLAVPQKRRGRKVREEIKKKVLNFYENDEFTRVCHGKRDFVVIRVNGKRVHKQKRILLCNLKEMYAAYVNSNGNEIGFSKFCELRPKWCVAIGARGAHSVCVCTDHQNVKLMLSATTIRGTYKSLIEKTVCNIESQQCMLRRCDNCPGRKQLKSYLSSMFTTCSGEDVVEFKQWIQTDRGTLSTRNATVEEFIQELTQKICSLRPHHFVSKNQSEYLRKLKVSKLKNEVIALMDFSENYSFLAEEGLQAPHWNRIQATIHPVVVYVPGPTQQCLSICFISDSLIHDVIAVYAFQTILLDHLKNVLGEVTAIHYFTDDCLAEYKNYQNFMNLCLHKDDFGIEAEWNFFGAGHGKSACEGIAGTVKRLATRASLQRPYQNQILTPIQLYHFCDANILGTKFFFVSREDLRDLRRPQERRFTAMKRKLPAMRHFHHFKPINRGQMQVSRVSGDDTSEIIKIF